LKKDTSLPCIQNWVFIIYRGKSLRKFVFHKFVAISISVSQYIIKLHRVEDYHGRKKSVLVMTVCLVFKKRIEN